MSIILAALDTSTAARPVMETALRIGQLTGADVQAVHVRVGPRESVDAPEALAALSEVPFKVLEGPVEPALLAAAGAPDVIAVVIGARGTPDGGHPVGHTARHILENTEKPVVVVPPEAVSPRLIQRLLVPLEGTEVSSRTVLERLFPLLVADVELVVIHVFTDTTLPAMLDHPGRDLEILGKEFLTRHFPHSSDIEFRTGSVATRVSEVSHEHDTDLIVLSWSQNPEPERARVIREVLGGSALPVLLLPDSPDSVDDPVKSFSRPEEDLTGMTDGLTR
jgi:nucleotide-binding universal stress UspA family protein